MAVASQMQQVTEAQDIAPNGHQSTDVMEIRSPLNDAAVGTVPMHSPDDVAGAAVFLASPAAAFMTGQVLLVGGGVVM